MASAPPPRAGIPDAALAYLYSNVNFLLRRADQRAVTVFNEAARDLATTLSQSHLLYAIGKVGPLAQVELGSIVAADSSTVSMVTATLEERGWIGRLQDPNDRRRKLLHVTPAGAAQLDRLIPIFRKATAQFQAPLGGETKTFLALLDCVVTAADGAFVPPIGFNQPALEALRIVRHSPHFLIRRCLQIMEAASSARIGLETLTLRQYALLLIIALDRGTSETGIAQTLGYELSNVSFIVRLLVNKGLIALDGAGRRRSYRTTEAGRAMLRTAEAPLTHALNDLLRPLDAGDRGALQRMLAALVRGDGDGGPPAFARITSRADWPMPIRPGGFTAGLEAQGDDRTNPEPLIALMVSAGDAAREQGSALLSGLGPTEQLTLRRLLSKALNGAKPSRMRRGKRAADKKQGPDRKNEPGNIRENGNA